MILCVCRDDLKNTWEVAQESLGLHPDVFCSAYLVFADDIPPLGINEDLYVIAHGVAEGSDGKPVIGDQGDSLTLDAPTFWENVKPIFPDGYQGDVYIFACESADPGPGLDFSFAEGFAVYVKGDRSVHCRVFGGSGEVGGMIPLPSDPMWIEADVF
ncbi:conserved hypothetical protein [Catenulispora acidiphila DSM 44928]|uniref:DUF4347 domain-containing protein n=1 Tax=Catenulispora acidiphila (strain DSM 44928 / JCM 14897 / NBRC 102108 / NRRL B-24433 / ID139908) TaxID=479433 RepID=C7PZA9_CATAD|nr:hypothetical protein [Catenulispora acidiphila]ACU71566.1 conserved hypothetical protein [Catenulispora acidiphila DSM 44928]